MFYHLLQLQKIIQKNGKGERTHLKYKEILNNKEINAYLKKGDANLGLLGYTDHSKTQRQNTQNSKRVFVQYVEN